MGYIEEVHKKNFQLIEKYSIKVGSIFTNGFYIEFVASIHPLYGWITTNNRDGQKIPQEVSKIFEQGWKIL